MLSNNQYRNTMSSFDFDGLCLSPIDLISDDEYNHYSDLDDNTIINRTDFSSEIDQYQQQVSSSSNSPSTETLLSKLICRVCGAPATGYNFDQITCESCKAFFRRNALRHMPTLKCRFSGSCIININTRRQCTYCRLKKCFDIKMRKDWIRTDEEIHLRQRQKLVKEQSKSRKLINEPQSVTNLPIVIRKKKRSLIKPPIEELIANPIFTQAYFGFNRNLSDEDHILLNNITHAYQLAADKADCSHVIKYTASASFSQFINDESVMHGSLIYFYKGISEFKQLDIEDQILLIKSNLINIIHLHYILVQNFQDFPHIGKHMSKWINEDFHHQMARTRRYFYCFMEHPLVLKLVLIVFIFNIGLSTTRGINQFHEYKNQRNIFECQNFYTLLLWRYLTHLYEEKEAIQAMEIIVMQILRFQMLMATMEDRVRQIPNHEKFHELMQSIFGLS